MDPRDAAGKAVGGVEKGAVAVGDLGRPGEQLRRDLRPAAVLREFREELRRLAGPDRPVAEQAARKALAADLPVFVGKGVLGEKVDDDVVVVAGVEGDLPAPGGEGGRPDQLEGLVAVEGRALDGDDVFDRADLLPLIVGEHPPADRRLEVKADDRQHLRDGAGPLDKIVLGIAGEAAGA